MGDASEELTYEVCNREERALCSHLFRLLLNSLHGRPGDQFFHDFIGLLAGNAEKDPPLAVALRKLDAEAIGQARVFTEVALVRDVFAKGLVSEDELQTCCLENNVKCTGVDWNVRQLLCVKPDLAIVFPGLLLVIEAKFTLDFDDAQLDRTASLVRAWHALKAPMLALGLHPSVASFVITLGAAAFNPHLDWERVTDAAERSFDPTDPSVVALQRGCALLPRKTDVVDAEGYDPDFVTFDGLAALREHIRKNSGGFVGFVGGKSALRTALGQPEYLFRRRYKWLASIHPSRHKASNWIPAADFAALVVVLFADVDSGDCAT